MPDPKTYYISDWHYDHDNVVRFDGRPFKSIEHMNWNLINRWNSVVMPEDTVYVLGDMFWCGQEEAEQVLSLLTGKIVMIRGNHDRIHGGGFRKRLSGVYDYLEVSDAGRKVILCHYPIPFFKNHMRGWLHLYGHVHNSKEYEMLEEFRRHVEKEQGLPLQMYNVGCMMPYMDYTPRTLDQILEANQ